MEALDVQGAPFSLSGASHPVVEIIDYADPSDFAAEYQLEGGPTKAEMRPQDGQAAAGTGTARGPPPLESRRARHPGGDTQDGRSREKLEHRLGILEEVVKVKHGGGGHEQVEPDVDKSVVVVGGFGEMDADAAEKYVEDAFDDAGGVELVFVTSPEPVVAFVRFESDTAATKFLRRQRRNQKFKDSGLWASENRSVEERRRVKVISKIKKFTIENENYEAKAVVVNYKSFKVHVRVGRKLVHWADVMDDATVQWTEGEHSAGEALRGAVEEVVEELIL